MCVEKDNLEKIERSCLARMRLEMRIEVIEDDGVLLYYGEM